MFQHPSVSKRKPKYRIPENIKSNYLTDKNLWETPRPEFYSLNIPDIILSIIEIHVKVSFDEIKAILKDNKVPSDLGFIHHAIEILIANGKVTKTKYTYTLVKE